MKRSLRIALLLLVLAFVALGAWTERARLASWDDPIWVAVYPINAGGPAVGDYIARLERRHLRPIGDRLARAASPYDLATDRPFELRLAPPVAARPPTPPADGNVLAVMLWSLRIRFWAWRHDTYDGPEEIRIFVQYHDPDTAGRLAHSLGLEKARIGIVNAYGDRRYRGSNRVVIAHELLHTRACQHAPRSPRRGLCAARQGAPSERSASYVSEAQRRIAAHRPRPEGLRGALTGPGRDGQVRSPHGPADPPRGLRRSGPATAAPAGAGRADGRAHPARAGPLAHAALARRDGHRPGHCRGDRLARAGLKAGIGGAGGARRRLAGYGVSP